MRSSSARSISHGPGEGAPQGSIRNRDKHPGVLVEVLMLMGKDSRQSSPGQSAGLVQRQTRPTGGVPVPLGLRKQALMPQRT